MLHHPAKFYNFAAVKSCIIRRGFHATVPAYCPKKPDLSNRTPWINITAELDRIAPPLASVEPISPHVSRTFWRDQSTHKQYVDWLGQRQGYKTMEDWYNIEKIDVTSTGGTHLLTGHYNTSPVRMLMQVYPDHPWEPWKFKYVPNPLENLGNHQVIKVNQERFVKHLETALRLKTLEDWYRVPARQLREAGAGCPSIVRKSGGWPAFCALAFPAHAWDRNVFESERKRQSQRWLRVLIQEFLPNSEVKEDYQHTELKYQPSKEPIQFDVFLPKENVAIEYQGQHHYADVSYFGAQKFVRDRDEAKRKIAAGIQLIEIPYWWDTEKESLLSTLHSRLPSLFPSPSSSSLPIPEKAPPKFTSSGTIPPVNLFMHPLSDWNPDMDPSGWWLSKGFDALRVYWDGEKLYSRKGHDILKQR